MSEDDEKISSGADDLALRAAWLYHVDGLTQAEVAERLYVSRPTVGRLLERAQASGIVHVEIDAQRLATVEAAVRLQRCFGLDEAIVVPSDPRGDDRERGSARLATAAAERVRGYLHPGAVIGVAWGDAVQRTLADLPASALAGVTLATLSGGIDYISQRIIGHPAIGGHLRAIPAPLIVTNPEMARALRKEPGVRDVLDLGRGAGLTLTGVGTALPGSSAARAGLVSDAEVAAFAAQGAVGDMLGEWFDAQGRVLAGATSQRRIGIELEELRSMPNVVGIAGGREKVAAIRGALRGGYIDVLITDEDVAQALVADHRQVASERRCGNGRAAAN
jgi:lsr operon transcriptional repressor